MASRPTLLSGWSRTSPTHATLAEVGSDADVQLMSDIAKDGKGRGYVALDPETIPQIFTTETLLISRDLIIEKPVTQTLEEAAQLLDLQREHGVVVQVGHVERFNPAFVQAKPWLKDPMFIETP